MKTAVVWTHEDLREVIAQNVVTIIVEGKLAEAVEKSLNLHKVSRWGVGLLGVSLALAPVAGWSSMVARLPVATLIGISAALSTAVAALSLALVLSAPEGYAKTRVEHTSDGTATMVELTKTGKPSYLHEPLG